MVVYWDGICHTTLFFSLLMFDDIWIRIRFYSREGIFFRLNDNRLLLIGNKSLFTIFSSTYACESLFSVLNHAHTQRVETDYN